VANEVQYITVTAGYLKITRPLYGGRRGYRQIR